MCLAVPAWADDECGLLPTTNIYTFKPEDYNFVVQGTDGWAFNGQQDLFDHFTITDENKELLLQLDAALKARGTHLVLAYVPQRSQAVPQAVPADNPLVLNRHYDPVTAQEHYVALINDLNKVGLLVVGIPQFRSGEKFFSKFEWQHWSADGAAEMAENVANAIIAKGWAGRNNAKPSLIEQPEAVSLAFAGTSFSDNTTYQDKLYELLGVNLWNAAINGGGLDDSITAYLNSLVYRQKPPQILLWEIPGYYPLGSREMTLTLRRALAAVYGPCDDHTLASAQVALTGEPVSLFPQVGDTPGYLYLEFDAPLRSSISISHGQSCDQIEGPLLPPADGFFFYLPPTGTTPEDIRLHLPEGYEGHQLKAYWCSLPD